MTRGQHDRERRNRHRKGDHRRGSTAHQWPTRAGLGHRNCNRYHGYRHDQHPGFQQQVGVEVAARAHPCPEQDTPSRRRIVQRPDPQGEQHRQRRGIAQRHVKLDLD